MAEDDYENKFDVNLPNAHDFSGPQAIENILLNVPMNIDPFRLEMPNEEPTKVS